MLLLHFMDLNQDNIKDLVTKHVYIHYNVLELDDGAPIYTIEIVEKQQVNPSAESPKFNLLLQR